jgi:hypothetical protein
MAQKSEASLGTQIVLAVLILFVAWVVLRWVIRVVIGVATTVVVVGAILFGLWLFANRTGRD